MNPSHAELIAGASIAFAKLKADTQIPDDKWDAWDRMLFEVAFVAGYNAGLAKAKRVFNEETT